jgi:hypothetical protein
MSITSWCHRAVGVDVRPDILGTGTLVLTQIKVACLRLCLVGSGAASPVALKTPA